MNRYDADSDVGHILNAMYSVGTSLGSICNDDRAVVNYLLHGLAPGSFYECAFAHVFDEMILHSHPSNTVMFLKELVFLVENVLPNECCGSFATVENWMRMTDDARRRILEDKGLVPDIMSIISA